MRRENGIVESMEDLGESDWEMRRLCYVVVKEVGSVGN